MAGALSTSQQPLFENNTRNNNEEGLPSRDYLLLAMLGITSRAQPLVFDYLTVRDRMQLPLVSKTLQRYLVEIEYTRCKDGRLYKVPFPGFPGLLEPKPLHCSSVATSSMTPSGIHNNITNDVPNKSAEQEESNSGLFPHQLASLRAMHRAENAETGYGALRGGVLADAPGLGKSITVLGLITSTAGKRPLAPPELWDPVQMAEGWQALTQNPGCRQDIYNTLKPFRTSHRIPANLYGELESHVLPPFSLDRFPRLRDFDLYVRRTVRDYATDAELEIFRQNLLHLQAGLHKSHRKVLKSEAGRRMSWERSLIPTCATLLVVPDALLEHWFQQIHQHLNRVLFADEKEGGDDEGCDWHDQNSGSTSTTKTHKNRNARGVVYLDGVGDIADARLPLVDVRMNSVPILPPYELSKYLIVVTTFSRCEHEYHQEALRQAGKRKHFDKKEGGESFDGNSVTSTSQSSSLLRMRWLRVIVDEGHELGTHEGGNGLTQFIHHMAAERRWVMSGTPTTGDEDDKQFTAKALDQIQRLLLFLRHPVYGSVPTLHDDALTTSPYVHTLRATTNQKTSRGTDQKRKAKELWVTKVKEPFLRADEQGRNELLQVLKSTMVLHRKEDIQLPKPIFRQIEIDVPLPDVVQSNIQQHGNESAAKLLSQYLISHDFQTLVDKAQGEYILLAIERARRALLQRGGALAVNGQTFMRMMSAEEMNTDSNILLQTDRRPVKAVVYSSNKYNLRDVSEVLYQKLDMENIAEAYDEPGYDCSAELSRFRHNRKEFRCCPICGYHNDYTGTAHNQRRGRVPMCKNTLLEVVRRDDPRVRFLIEPERVVRALPVSQGGNVTEARLNGLLDTQYGMSKRSWRIGDILEVDIRDQNHPLLKPRESLETWHEYGSEKCIALAESDQFMGKDWFFGPLPTPGPLQGEEIAGGRDLRHRVEVVLSKWQPCSRFHNTSRWYNGPTLRETTLESRQENVFILALDAGLAHGLDLSFVTHIFLLESIDDAALLEQITSRAHRLGATGPVIVETVNPYYKLDEKTEEAVAASNEPRGQELSHKTSAKSSKSKNESLTKVVCEHCYRQFDSMAEAMNHEQKQCPRNPAIDAVDPWHLSSVYREIRPPLPQMSTLPSPTIPADTGEHPGELI